MTTVCFLTICGGGEDYEFLLGSIEHHSRMGVHVVLDTTPVGQERRFMNLPPHVVWIWEPTYGQGWKNFKFRDALTRGVELARNYADVIAVLDCDEFYTQQLRWILEDAAEKPLCVETIHWLIDPKTGRRRPYMLGESEWHLRLWPAKAEVAFPPNQAWVKHPLYNGNDHHHAVPRFQEGTEILKAPGLYHHHVHHALGNKSKDDTDARTIPNWGRGVPTIPVKWPEPLGRWRDLGILPSTEFEVPDGA